MRYFLILLISGLFFFQSCKDDSDSEVETEKLSVSYVYMGDKELSTAGDNIDVSVDEPVQIRFNKPVKLLSAQENITLENSAGQLVELTFLPFDQNKLFKIAHPVLAESSTYTLTISGSLEGEGNETFDEQIYVFSTLTNPLVLESISIDDEQVNPAQRIMDVSRNPQIDFHFNIPVGTDDLGDYSSLSTNGIQVAYTLSQVDDKTISLSADQTLEDYKRYRIRISSNLEQRTGRPFDGLDMTFFTQLDSTPKFPEITDDELLTRIQQQTFKYFWDFGHPVSGLARERNTSGETVTSGGSGFGIMAIIVGIERGFITREEGIDRLHTIVDFLETADRFHGAWSHWLNGTTGEALPFSSKDDGGDLVETSYMAAGLLTARQYLNASDPDENVLIDKINALWNAIEWDWYTRGGQNVLYWHWSPNYNWEMNMQIKGYNEALITYIMAASSSTHSISADVYHQGWALDGGIVNGNEYYGIPLPVGQQYGGPLFFAHYTFMGIDPRNLSDQYADYWEQNRNHTLINRAHCIANPNNYVGYSGECWGLTASDNHKGYSAHSPTNDLGVITPTAAISSIPYTPEESMAAIRFFYYQLGDRLWGEYGFYDAFNVTEEWTADSYLAIDQGPVIVMIENYRTGLIWNLLMSCPEVRAGLSKLGFIIMNRA
ncbi:glucoamylase family protein [Anaerophaga thermohalophila]|uniref:glucoamylase family protein n=1 Tax=Anaerophaga thermohalophila TaxID=177400 RepID=UPI000237C0F0|nr:glucoamylase family protein [Anaerophaga thermohalophila]